jgi:hypothetical protein
MHYGRSKGSLILMALAWEWALALVLEEAHEQKFLLHKDCLGR